MWRLRVWKMMLINWLFPFERRIVFYTHITFFLIWCIRHTNVKKDRNLSRRLHYLADDYDTKPKGKEFFDKVVATESYILTEQE